MAETETLGDDYYEDDCSECGGDGFIENDCFEDTCCCADPLTSHGISPCPVCFDGGIKKH